MGFTIDLGKLHNVSLGQGQEAVAEVAMEKAAKEGHWVILQVRLRARRMRSFSVTNADAVASPRSFRTSTWSAGGLAPWRSSWSAAVKAATKITECL